MVDFGKINLELQSIQKYPPLQSHGLSQDEPLIYEAIIKSCFRNPDRKKFPDFLKRRGWAATYNLYTEHEDPEYWISLLKPDLIQKFNNSGIRLTDTSHFYNRAQDEQPYIEAIRTSTWSGPYKSESLDWYYFVAINRSGDNQHFVYTELNLNSLQNQVLYLLYRKNRCDIAPCHRFIC